MIAWLKRWGWIVGIVIGAAVLYLLTRNQKHLPLDALDSALKAARAEEKAEKMAAELGHERALQAIEEEHRDRLEQLKKEDAAKVEELSKNPGKLARMLARDAGSRSS